MSESEQRAETPRCIGPVLPKGEVTSPTRGTQKSALSGYVRIFSAWSWVESSPLEKMRVASSKGQKRGVRWFGSIGPCSSGLASYDLSTKGFDEVLYRYLYPFQGGSRSINENEAGTVGTLQSISVRSVLSEFSERRCSPQLCPPFIFWIVCIQSAHNCHTHVKMLRAQRLHETSLDAGHRAIARRRRRREGKE